MIRHPRIDQCGGQPQFLCGPDQIRPDFGLEHHQSGRTDQPERFPDKGQKVDRAEDHLHAVGDLLPGDLLRGCRGCGQDEFSFRIDFFPGLQRGQSQIGLPDADRVHPDGVIQRFQALLFLPGEDGEALRIILLPSRAADQFDNKSRQEKQKNQRKKKIIEKIQQHSKNSRFVSIFLQ